MIKRLAIADLAPGMITLEKITTPTGQNLAPAGTKLTKQLINKIKLYRIDTVLVDAPDTLVIPAPVEKKAPATPTPPMAPIVPMVPVVPMMPIMPQVLEPVPQTTFVREPSPLEAPTRIAEITPHTQKVMTSKEFQKFRMDYLKGIEKLKEAFSKVISDRSYTIDTQDLVDCIAPLFLSKKTITEIFDMISQMHSMDDSVYAHSINVSLICRMIGRWLHLEKNDLDVLTCCGLFHDIGKLSIPDDVLNKPGKLTDEEFALIKSHPKAGYELLRSQNVDLRIKQSALMHHERYDGSGYPMGLTSDMLADEAMIVAIADVYDAMTAARSYRAQLCPFEVIAKFEQEGFQKYHTKYIFVFLNNIASTYQNNRVMLNDGRVGKIVMLNQNKLSRPIIQLDEGECIDLSTAKELHIAKVL